MVDSERQITPIVSVDLVRQSFEHLEEGDEAAAVRVSPVAREVFERLTAEHHGHVADSSAPGLTAKFSSAADAVSCSVEFQREWNHGNTARSGDDRVMFRIGVHLGDVAINAGRLHGTGVRVATRLAHLAEAGGVWISAGIHAQIANRLRLRFEDMGRHTVKDITEPVHAYRIRGRDLADSATPGARVRTFAVRAGYSLATLVLLVGITGWVSWPAPLGLALDLAGLGGGDPPRPEGLSLVVLPFDNLTGDPEQEYFADGFAESLTTDLAHFPSIFVIARNSAFTYKGKKFRIRDVGRELGVQFALEGSIQKFGNSLRVNAQLIDATTELHLWSGRYDLAIEGKFENANALQDDILMSVFESVGYEVQNQEIQRAHRKQGSLSAREAYFKGVYQLARLSVAGNREARKWLYEAIRLDPSWGLPHGLLTFAYNTPKMMGWNFDPSQRERAAEHAQRCIELEPGDAVCHIAVSTAAAEAGDLKAAIRHAELAVEDSPGFFVAHMMLGVALAGDGQLIRAFQHTRKAVRLNPRGFGVTGMLAVTNLRAGRDERAIEIFEGSRRDVPDAIPPRLVLASHYLDDGNHEEAKIVLAEVLAVNPSLTTDQIMEIGSLSAIGVERLGAIQRNMRKLGLPDPV
jgi:adenylate cyclase